MKRHWPSRTGCWQSPDICPLSGAVSGGQVLVGQVTSISHSPLAWQVSSMCFPLMHTTVQICEGRADWHVPTIGRNHLSEREWVVSALRTLISCRFKLDCRAHYGLADRRLLFIPISIRHTLEYRIAFQYEAVLTGESASLATLSRTACARNRSVLYRCQLWRGSEWTVSSTSCPAKSYLNTRWCPECKRGCCRASTSLKSVSSIRIAIK